MGSGGKNVPARTFALSALVSTCISSPLIVVLSDRMRALENSDGSPEMYLLAMYTSQCVVG